MPTVSLEYYGVEGSGRTMKEAKEDAGRKIKKSLSGSYTPEIVQYRGNAVLIYREPTGWRSCIIADSGVIRDGAVYGGLEGQSKEEAIRKAQLHVAQCGWTHEDGIVAPDFLSDRSRRSDFLSWATFQVRYKAARAFGLSDHEAHSATSGYSENAALNAAMDEAVRLATPGPKRDSLHPEGL